MGPYLLSPNSVLLRLCKYLISQRLPGNRFVHVAGRPKPQLLLVTIELTVTRQLLAGNQLV